MNSTRKPSAQQAIRSPGFFAKKPVIGLVMFLLGFVVFGVLAYGIQGNGSLVDWDMAVAKTFRAMQTAAPWNLMENLLLGLFLGKEVVVIIGAVLAAYFLHKRFWRELTMLIVSLGGGALLWYWLSQVFDRPQPADHLDVLLLSGSSFPSGSAMMAVLCYGLLAYHLIPNLTSLLGKWFVAFLAIVAILLVGLSSLLFGTHYASDVIAGYALGIAFAGLVLTLVERYFPKASDTYQSSQNAIPFQGLRISGLFKKSPSIGMILISLGILAFAVLAYNVLTKGSLLQLDQSVYEELLTKAKAASPALNDIMLFGFFVGKEIVQVIVMTLSLYFLYRRYWLEFSILQISTQGGGLIKNFLVDYFSRARPAIQLGLGTTELPSFPSGHALGTTICFGFLTYLLIPKMSSPFWKWSLGFGIVVLVLFEGFSRIFHGNHYLSDVLASYALGIAWLALVCTIMEKLFLKRQG